METAQAKHTEEFDLIGPNVWARPGTAEVFNFNTNKEVSAPDHGGNGGKETKVSIGEGAKAKVVPIWGWGANNLLPNEREALLMDNNLVPELVATKMAVVEGSGRYFFTKRWEGGKEVIEEVEPPSWWTALERRTKSEIHMDFDELFDLVMKNLFIHANAPVEFRRNKKGTLYSLEAWECINSRSGKQNAMGYVEEWFWCGNWKSYKNKRADFPVVATPAYNFSDFHDQDSGRPRPRSQERFVLHVYDPLLFDGYYGVPGYWGGRKWISAQNKIPVFHDSNIDNGYFLRLHVEFPKDYFTDHSAMAQAVNDDVKKSLKEKESKARKAFIKKVNDLMAGPSGNKVIFTEYEINKQLGKDYPGIKIKVLETNKLDESMLKLFDKGNEAIISAQGIHPALASIQTQGKLSSGSELRNALNIYAAIKAPRHRRMIGKIYETARQIEDPNSTVLMGFRDIEVTTLDENPAGVQPMNDPYNPENPSA
jgi:hypothetical protein